MCSRNLKCIFSKKIFTHQNENELVKELLALESQLNEKENEYNAWSENLNKKEKLLDSFKQKIEELEKERAKQLNTINTESADFLCEFAAEVEKLEGIFSKYGKEVEYCECDLDTLIKIKHKLAAEEEKKVEDKSVL